MEFVLSHSFLYEVFVQIYSIKFTFLNFKSIFLRKIKHKFASSLDKAFTVLINYPQALWNLRRRYKFAARVKKWPPGLPKFFWCHPPRFEYHWQDLFSPPPQICWHYTTGPPFKQNIFRYTKPMLHWSKPYLSTLGYPNLLGYLITLGYIGHLVSQCWKTWGEPYLYTLRYFNTLGFLNTLGHLVHTVPNTLTVPKNPILSPTY